MMKRILIAIDYHPVSEKVVEAGYKLAQQMGAEVCLLHVMANVNYYNVDYPTFMGYSGYNEMAVNLEIASEMREVVEGFLKTAASHLDDESVETHLSEGDAAPAILEYSKTWNADLLVMGTHSHSVWEKLLMGTVASSVLEETEIPIYMVPVKK